FAEHVKPLRDEIRANAEAIAQQADVAIEFIRDSKLRMEDHIQQILSQRGNAPGLVHILSAMETCATFEPWQDKSSGRTYLRHDTGKCLHYYFYFIDEQLGLCYLRVPTWAPYRLQFYFNGHSWLAAQLRKKAARFTLKENVFLDIEDFAKAQELADDFSVTRLHRRLDHWARL